MTDWHERWRFVRVDKLNTGVTAVRIERLAGGAFLFHTREPKGEFDRWLESEEDVVTALKNYIFDNLSLVEKRGERVPMLEDRFWNLISANIIINEDGSIEASGLVRALQALNPSQIINFQECCDIHFTHSRTWSLWGAAELIHDTVSDDTFDYFRSWLIGRGRETYKSALADPDSLADVATPEALDDVVYCSAENAYRLVTGEELPLTLREWPDLGKTFDLTDDLELQHRYPKLYAKFRE